ncbi:Tripartite-type tricarboxylate transporter, receptor component TctC [Noviherbaspirillum humi]|uniref:Tripartite-type tricarboxylate transporter, receptor component TctC n=1 Tax=Noviherbaspirillum humi TaxID=1688639 RepID=A0A239I3N5_9BURK|nr:tripartite tricarboxylate transporter substrate binding protein [Noviherbaspirillum humi]SNS88119.1 Tripartite-type tricarboxylate transporter, receptor component TctC [Noviherbaspirillum humi]
MQSLIRFIGVASLCLAAAGAAQSQTYPSQPVTLIVPYTPGTGIDIIARTVGPKLQERLGQPFIVDNRPGASGNIGAEAVAKAAPNGNTLMITVNTFTMTPALYKKIPYDPVADFTPISKLAFGSLALVVNPDALPVKSLDELASYAKARPGKINYGSPGNGTPQHLAVEILKERLGIDMVHVPYKGAAGANTDLLGGHIQLMVLPVHTALPFVRQGKLRILAVSGESRSVLAPDVPSMGELGIKNLDVDLYFWLAGPANLPKPVVARLNQEMAAIMAMPDVKESLMRQGLVPATSSPEEINDSIKKDVVRWKTFTRQHNITAD